MSVTDTNRNEAHIPRDEKGKFTPMQKDSDQAPSTLAPHGNIEMKNILKHIGTCFHATSMHHFYAPLSCICWKSHAITRANVSRTQRRWKTR